MKIDPNGPWYPYTPSGRGPTSNPGVTIRLKLIESFTHAILSTYRQPQDGSPVQTIHNDAITKWADELADAAIERADRDEGKPV